MPGSPKHNPPTPSPPQPPWTVAEAQAGLGEVADQLQALVTTLEAIHGGLPPPADIDDRQEGRKPYDQATDILATIEVVLEDDLLCRARHNRYYAEPRIMPIALRRLALSR
jgi:hypothetical protein